MSDINKQTASLSQSGSKGQSGVAGVSAVTGYGSGGTAAQPMASVPTVMKAPEPITFSGHAVEWKPPPSSALRVFNDDGNVQMELVVDEPTEEQTNAMIEIFRNSSKVQ